MNTAEKHEQQLRELLETLETCLGTPVIPGELPDWVGSVRKAFDALEQFLHTSVKDSHEQQLAQISDEDPELLNRVEQLREEDREIMDDMKSLDDRLGRLTAKAAQIEPHESKADNEVQQLVDDGLSFVARVRKQETAMTTWLMEAFQRDRGIAG